MSDAVETTRTTHNDAGNAEPLVQPQVLKGFQDYLPAQAIVRHHVIDAVRGVLERYGFAPIDTPALEYLATLVGTAGEETNKQIFRLKSPEHEDIGLRFDLTVPFARIVAQYGQDLKMPFRRYHYGSVWRADKPGPGRFRQFMQFDFDAAGSSSMAVDAEIVGILTEIMAALQVDAYVVQFNHRKVLDALLHAAGLDDEATQKHVMRVIDKLDKVGLRELEKELGEGRVDESGDPIRGVGLDAETIGTIVGFLALTGDTRRDVLNTLRDYLPANDVTESVLSEVAELLDGIDALNLPEDKVQFLPSLARGLDYYSGPVFETVLTEARNFGSIMGGGRYDGLVRRFLDQSLPATGASVGVDRLIAALESIGALKLEPTTTQALVVVFNDVPLPEYLRLAGQLRAAGINTEIYFGEYAGKVGRQLSFADERNIPVAVIMGGSELAGGTVQVKDMLEGKAKRAGIEEHEAYRSMGRVSQQEVPRDGLVEAVRALLG